MKIIHIPTNRRYDLARNEFTGPVLVEIDGREVQIQAKRGLDTPDGRMLAKTEAALLLS